LRCGFSSFWIKAFLISLSPFFFGAGHAFRMAVEAYSEAIDVNPLDQTLWCNRALARIKLEEFGTALSDASK
jgi:hypothetical protein